MGVVTDKILGINQDKGVQPFEDKHTPAESAAAIAGAVTPYAASTLAFGAGGLALGGPPGAAAGIIVGGLAIPLADASMMLYNHLSGRKDAQLPSAQIIELMEGLGYPKPEGWEKPVSSALAGATNVATSLPALGRLGQSVVRGAAPTAGQRVAQTMTEMPKSQVASAAAGGAAAEHVLEKTRNPYLSLGAGALAGGPFGYRGRTGGAPTVGQLRARGSNLYEAADDAGVQFGGQEFQGRIANLTERLRKEEGFHPNLNTKVNTLLGVLGEQTDDFPFSEWGSYRQMARNLTKSTEPTDRHLGNIILDELDDFLDNASPQAVIGGDANRAGNMLNSARTAWRRFRTTETVEDVLERASLRKGATKSRNNMASAIEAELRVIARNPRRMGRFTTGEQAQINAIVKGESTWKNTLELIGRFSPFQGGSDIATKGAAAAAGAFGVGKMGASMLGVNPSVAGIAAGSVVTALTLGARAVAGVMGVKAGDLLRDTAALGYKPKPSVSPQPAIRGLQGALLPQRRTEERIRGQQ